MNLLVSIFYFLSLMVAVGIGKQMALEVVEKTMKQAYEDTLKVKNSILNEVKNEQATDKTEETATP